MKETLANFAQLKEHTSSSMCVVSITSHGNMIDKKSVISGRDMKTIGVMDDVIRPFSVSMRNTLQSKPKWFILGPCRGDKLLLHSTNIVEGGMVLKDILISYATTPGYVSWRNIHLGDIYMTKLCNVLQSHPYEAVSTILRILKSDVRNSVIRIQNPNDPNKTVLATQDTQDIPYDFKDLILRRDLEGLNLTRTSFSSSPLFYTPGNFNTPGKP